MYCALCEIETGDEGCNHTPEEILQKAADEQWTITTSVASALTYCLSELAKLTTMRSKIGNHLGLTFNEAWSDETLADQVIARLAPSIKSVLAAQTKQTVDTLANVADVDFGGTCALVLCADDTVGDAWNALPDDVRDDVCRRLTENLHTFSELLIKDVLKNVQGVPLDNLLGGSYWKDRIAEHLEKHYGVKQ